MSAFKLTTQGFRGPSGQFVSRIPAELRQTLTTSARGLQARIRAEAPIADPANAPPGHRAGTLRQGITVTEQYAGARGTLAVHSAAPYTGYVRQGRGPIVAAPNKRLRFYINGRYVYARRVRGVAPNDFLTRGVTAYEPQLRAEIGRLVGRIRAAFSE